MKKHTTILIILSICLHTHAQTFEWAKQWGGIGAEQYSSIAADSDGNVYTCGTYYDTFDFDPGPDTLPLNSTGTGGIFITKLNPEGNLVWANLQNGDNLLFGGTITLDAAGNLYSIGSFQGNLDCDPGPGVFTLSTSPSRTDVFVSKIDPAGDLIWAKKMGGAGDDYAREITVDAAGNVFTLGVFEGTADFDPGVGIHFITAVGLQDYFISKLDVTGKFVWAKRLAGGIPSSPHYFNSADTDPEGNFYLAGAYADTLDFDPGPGVFELKTPDYVYRAFVLKLDPMGNFLWVKDMGGENSSCRVKGMELDADGNILMVGTYWGEVDLDPGPGTANFSTINTLEFLVKLDPQGQLVWARSMGGPGHQFDNTMTLDAQGNVYTTGAYEGGAIDLDPGPDVFPLGWSGYYDAYISKTDASGNFVWAKTISAPIYEGGIDICTDPFGNVFTSGYFFGTVDFDPGPGVNPLKSNGNQDIFLLKLSQNNVGTSDLSTEAKPHVFPNPSNGVFNVESTQSLDYVLVDALGTVLRRGEVSSLNPSINLSDFASGVYFVKLGQQVIKLVKQ